MKHRIDNKGADDQAGHQGGDLVAHAPVMRARAYKRHGGPIIEKGGGYTISRGSLSVKTTILATQTERACREEPVSMILCSLLDVECNEGSLCIFWAGAEAPSTQGLESHLSGIPERFRHSPVSFQVLQCRLHLRLEDVAGLGSPVPSQVRQELVEGERSLPQGSDDCTPGCRRES